MDGSNASGSPIEVRRCARCGKPTLMCTRDWQHHVLGLPTESRTFDLECSSCGARVTLHPHKKIAIERLFALLMIPAVVPSVIFFASARRKARAWTDNPVVEGAYHSPVGPPGRMCECGRVAACVKMAQHRTRSGLSLGTRYAYRCRGCGRAFTVRDVRAVVFYGAAALASSALGALIVAFPPGSGVGAEGTNRWFGVGLVVIAACVWLALGRAMQSRARHPEVEPPA